MEGRDEHRLQVGKPEGKRPLWKPRRRWEDNIKMDGGQSCAMFWWINLREIDHWRDPNVDGRIILG
jgi:hypothetical protein